MKNNKKIVLGSVVALELSVGVLAPNLTKADNNPSSQTVSGATLNSNTPSVSNESDINKAPAAKDTKLNKVSPLNLKANGQAQPDAQTKKAEELQKAKENAKENINGTDLSKFQKANFIQKVDNATTIEEAKQYGTQAKELASYIFEVKFSLPELKEGQDINEIINSFNKALNKADVDKVKKSVVDSEGFKEDQELENLKAQTKEEIDKLDLSQVQKDHFKSLVDKAEDKKSVNQVKTNSNELLDAIVDAKMNKLSPTDDQEFIQKAMEALDKALTKEDVNKAVEKTNKEVKDSKDEKEESLKALKTQIKEEIEKLDLSQFQKDHFKSLVDKAEDEKSVNQVKTDAKELLDAIIDAKYNKLSPTDNEEIKNKALEMLDKALTKDDVEKVIEQLNAEVKNSENKEEPKNPEEQEGYATIEEAEAAAKKALKNDPINNSYEVDKGLNGRYYFRLFYKHKEDKDTEVKPEEPKNPEVKKPETKKPEDNKKPGKKSRR